MWTSIAYNSPVWVVNKPTAPTAPQAEIDALLANPLVKYDEADAANALKQIYAQSWIDMYRQPWDAWLLQRRTGGKTPKSTENEQYYNTNFGVYNRFVYPENELSYNYENYKVAAGDADLPSEKIWVMP